jgi:phosphoglycerol transferase MdoB-like AlkP superfamily enzyme
MTALLAPFYASNGGLVAGLAIGVVIAIIYYLYFAYCLMKMAEQLKANNPWLAFIPIANYWLLCEMDNKEASWFWIMLIFSFCFPIVTAVMVILILMDVSQELGFTQSWGILAIIPIFNIYVFYKLGFTGPLAKGDVTY